MIKLFNKSQYFKDEINHAERLKPSEFNEPEGIIEEPEDIENQFDDGHMENAPDGSSQNENGIDAILNLQSDKDMKIRQINYQFQLDLAKKYGIKINNDNFFKSE